MQKEIGNLIRDFIIEKEEMFMEIQGGSFVRLDTGEFFTKAEHDKLLQRSLEDYKVKIFSDINGLSAEEFGIENNQHLINTKSKKKRYKKVKSRYNFDNGEFNMVYRCMLGSVTEMKLSNNEKLVYYIIRDMIQYPTNSVMMNGHIPSIKELEPLIGLSERSIIASLKTLEEKGMLKRVQSGHKKCIYFNPQYYASGKDLEIETLKLFGLIECNDEKIDNYIDD